MSVVKVVRLPGATIRKSDAYSLAGYRRFAFHALPSGRLQRLDCRTAAT